jgi:hypothetical protein
VNIPKSIRDSNRIAVIKYFGDDEKFIPDILYPEYHVSNYGRVFSTYTNKLLKTTKNDKGYYYVGLYSNGFRTSTLVHVMVARTFLNNLEYEVNHISANKSDNSLFNLELVTRRENLDHAKKAGLFKSRKLELSPSFKFTKEIVTDMIKMQDSGYKLKDIAKKYNTSCSYVCTMIKQAKGGRR